MLNEDQSNQTPPEKELPESQTPNNPPPPSVIKPEDDPKFLKNMAVEANRAAQREYDRASQLEAELADLKRKASGGGGNEETLPSKDEFYNDPVQTTAKIVKKMMDQTVAPLMEVAGRMERKDSYTEMKSKFKNDPRFKTLFEKGEHIVDSVALKVKNLDENAFLGTLYQIRGAVAAGDIELELDVVPKVEQPNGHLRPSSPPAPTPQKSKRRDLTETEKREARRNGLSDDQYLDIMDTPDEVTFDHINSVLKEKK